MQVRFLGWEDTLEEDMATHSSILAWRIPWTEEPGRLLYTGSQRVEHNGSEINTQNTPTSSPSISGPPAPALPHWFPQEPHEVHAFITPILQGKKLRYSWFHYFALPMNPQSRETTEFEAKQSSLILNP